MRRKEEEGRGQIERLNELLNELMKGSGGDMCQEMKTPGLWGV